MTDSGDTKKKGLLGRWFGQEHEEKAAVSDVVENETAGANVVADATAAPEAAAATEASSAIVAEPSTPAEPPAAQKKSWF